MIEIIFILILFQNIINRYISVFSYWDELMAIVLIVWLVLILLRTKRIRIEKDLSKVVYCFFVVLIIGIISTVVNDQLQDSNIAKYKDILAFSKMILVIFGVRSIIMRKNATNIINRCASVSRYITIIISICAVLDYIVGIGMHRGFRYIPIFVFLFSHATYAVAAYIIMMTVFIADSVDRNKWYIIACAALTILTMRSKGIVCVIIILLLLLNRRYNLISWAKNKAGKWVEINWWYVTIAIGAVLWGLREKINYYLSWGIKAARTGLYIIGWEIVKDYFPLGTGYGTFASFISGEYYSKVYYLYNMQNVTGMTPTNYSYISDVFWPYIYGEFGFIGFIVYSIMLFLLLRYSLKEIDVYKDLFYSVILIWLYALVASFAEAFFTNTSGVQFAILIAVLWKMRDEQKEKQSI